MGEPQVYIDREEDGRWIGEVKETPEAIAYGNTPEEAQAKALNIHLEALFTQEKAHADRLALLLESCKPSGHTSMDWVHDMTDALAAHRARREA